MDKVIASWKNPLRKRKNDRQTKCGGKLSNCENPKHILTYTHIQLSYKCPFGFSFHLLLNHCYDLTDGKWVYLKKNAKIASETCSTSETHKVPLAVGLYMIIRACEQKERK